MSKGLPDINIIVVANNIKEIRESLISVIDNVKNGFAHSIKVHVLGDVLEDEITNLQQISIDKIFPSITFYESSEYQHLNYHSTDEYYSMLTEIEKYSKINDYVYFLTDGAKLVEDSVDVMLLNVDTRAQESDGYSNFLFNYYSTADNDFSEIEKDTFSEGLEILEKIDNDKLDISQMLFNLLNIENLNIVKDWPNIISPFNSIHGEWITDDFKMFTRN